MVSQRRNSVIRVVLPIIGGLIIVGAFSIYFIPQLFPDYAAPMIDVDKQTKIDEYMEKNSGISASGTSYVNGILYYDSFGLYCENTYYGQLNRYAYAVVFCARYSWKYLYDAVYSYDNEGRVIPNDRRPIKITREIHMDEAETIPTRFLIADDDSFTILGFDQADYQENPGQVEEIFPLKISALGDGRPPRWCRAEQRFYDDNKDAPKPTFIEEIYGQRNPTIVYGDDNIKLCSQ